ncbi:MAG: nitroreductase family protein [Desulfomonilia bacterium]
MHYTVPVTELISRRSSWRTFQEIPLTEDHAAALREFMQSLPPPPFGSTIRIGLVDAGASQSRFKGTYGIARGARSFLVGAAQSGQRVNEDYGYLFEAVILRATELGLGTCWMGGTFSTGFFAEKILLGGSEIIPAVSPVGYPAGSRSLIDALFVAGAGSRRRKNGRELFFQEKFGVPCAVDDSPYRIPFEMVRIGPSASNRQPWRILCADGNMHFFLQRSIGYKAMFKDIDIQKIDMGIAMLHFELTCRERSLPGNWEVKHPEVRSLPGNTEYIVSWVPDHT